MLRVSRFRSRPPRLDLALALGLCVLLEIEVWGEHLHPISASAPLVLLEGGALAWRRIAPLESTLTSFVTVALLSAAGVSLHKPASPILVMMLALFSVAAYDDLRRALVGLAIPLALVYVSIGLSIARGDSFGGSDVIFISILTLSPWLVGRAMGGRIRYAGELEDRAARLEREREEHVRRAAADERARIARELHDVIAHSVSVMVVQAGAAEEVLRKEPEQALSAVRSVQETGRQALAEMARLLGILRRDGEELGFAPQPGLHDLEALLAQTRAAGLPVELRVEGEPRPLPLGADLSAYRIVQEALTNARKHAGDASAEVVLRYEPDAVVVEVRDDGSGSANGFGGGHGLVGMRERVALFGGELEAAPDAGGGFHVRARLPDGAQT